MSICKGIYQKRIKGNPFLSFKAKYKIVESGCWEWQGSLNEKGYGQLFLRNGKIILAHRYSFEIFIGDLMGLFVCHRCDNPKCVNPFHLFRGTNTDNMRDAKAKGRLQIIAHPSVNHYDNHGCRCDECKELKRLSRKFGYAYANSLIGSTSKKTDTPITQTGDSSTVNVTPAPDKTTT